MWSRPLNRCIGGNPFGACTVASPGSRQDLFDVQQQQYYNTTILENKVQLL